MCVANSARSQMAEGLAKRIFGDKAWIESAGSEPKSVNASAIKVMQEIGIDISNQHSKSIDQLSPKFIVGLKYIVTLCADEVCPMMVAQNAKRLHWPFSDPAEKAGNEEEQLARFRDVRDKLKTRLENFAQGNCLR